MHIDLHHGAYLVGAIDIVEDRRDDLLYLGRPVFRFAPAATSRRKKRHSHQTNG